MRRCPLDQVGHRQRQQGGSRERAGAHDSIGVHVVKAGHVSEHGDGDQASQQYTHECQPQRTQPPGLAALPGDCQTDGGQDRDRQVDDVRGVMEVGALEAQSRHDQELGAQVLPTALGVAAELRLLWPR